MISRDRLSSIAELTLMTTAITLAAVLLGGALQHSVGTASIERAAEAGTVSTIGDLSILTGASQGEDVVYVLDNTAERLLIYKLSNPERMEYLETLSLQRVFVEGRRRFGGER